jgi:hypothetical protein
MDKADDEDRQGKLLPHFDELGYGYSKPTYCVSGGPSASL